jgi:hypothetical protein
MWTLIIPIIGLLLGGGLTLWGVIYTGRKFRDKYL